MFRGGEIERHMREVAAAFLAGSGLLFIHDEAIGAKAQIGAQAALGGIEFFEQATLEKLDEEALGKILGIGGGAIPAQTNVFVDGLPVGGAEGIDSAGTFGLVGAAGGGQDRPTGHREAIRGEVGRVGHEPSCEKSPSMDNENGRSVSGSGRTSKASQCDPAPGVFLQGLRIWLKRKQISLFAVQKNAKNCNGMQ